MVFIIDCTSESAEIFFCGGKQTKMPRFYPDSLNPTLKDGTFYILPSLPGDSDMQ